MAIDFSFFDNTSLFIKSDKRKGSGKNFCKEKLFFRTMEIKFFRYFTKLKGAYQVEISY